MVVLIFSGISSKYKCFSLTANVNVIMFPMTAESVLIGI